MDSNQFTQQLVEFSQVEQQIDTNTNLQTLIIQGTSQSGAYATGYLGKTVTVTGGQGALTNGEAQLELQSGAPPPPAPRSPSPTPPARSVYHRLGRDHRRQQQLHLERRGQ